MYLNLLFNCLHNGRGRHSFLNGRRFLGGGGDRLGRTRREVIVTIVTASLDNHQGVKPRTAFTSFITSLTSFITSFTSFSPLHPSPPSPTSPSSPLQGWA